MPDVRLTLAMNDYDHVRDLAEGDVALDGIELTWLRLAVEETFYRFVRFREWEVTELSLAKYCALRGAGDDSVIAIPVFPSRCFRHSSIFVNANGPVDDPRALAGGRIGIPEWTQTATVWARGVLTEQYGVDLREVRWTQAGTNEPGRVEGVALALLDGITVVAEHDRTLNALLLAGELDAIIAAHPPTDFADEGGRIVRLFSDHRSVEEAYYRATGVFPIMHVVAIRRDVYERTPWVAMSLFKGFEEAKRRSLERVLDSNAPRLPIPWGFAAARDAQSLFGDDPWPYGLEPNRTTLETFLALAHDQGITTRQLATDELFAPEVLSAYRV